MTLLYGLALCHGTGVSHAGSALQRFIASPPLWALTGVLAVALGAYVWLLLWMKEQGAEGQARRRVQEAGVPDHPKPVRQRHVSRGTSAKPAYNGLGVFDNDDLTNIVVRPVRKVGMAGA